MSDSNMYCRLVLHVLRAVYTRVFCVRFSVRDGAAAQHFPLRDHVRRKAKEAVGQWRHHGRRNGRKKRECRRPLTLHFGQIFRVHLIDTLTRLDKRTETGDQTISKHGMERAYNPGQLFRLLAGMTLVERNSVESHF
jgi:hypothetical protein